MSIRLACPSCRQPYNLDDTMRGKTVRCSKCRSPFAIPAPAGQGHPENGGRPSEERIASTPRPASAARPVSRDEDDMALRRPAERRSRSEDEDARGGNNLVPILVGVGAAALGLVGLIVCLVVIALRPSPSGNQAAAGSQSPAVPATAKVDPAPAPAPGPVAAPNPLPPAEPPERAEAAVPAGPAPGEMAADVVQKVKQSTAYLRVRLPAGEAQGSGFFALEQGILVTNAHVVGMKGGGNPPRNVEVVVHSGEAGEAKLPGTVLGVDRENDLAVLRVEGDPARLPPPLPVGSAAGLMETQNVYVFGFPFGAQLGKNITVSKSAISALRRSGDVLKQVQVNGGMHPGNSGGPVTDTRGVVVGVSVAGIEGTQINFAVPGEFIRPLVERSKSNPLNPNPPGPVVRNDPPPGPTRDDPLVGPAPGAGLEGDLAAMKGTWQSGPVPAAEGRGSGTVKLSINPRPGSLGGQVQVEIATKQGGRTTSSKSSYTFTLEQEGGQRLLVTHISRLGRGMVFVYRFDGGQLVLNGKLASVRIVYNLTNVPLRRTAAEPEMAPPAGNPANPAAPPQAGGGPAKGSPTALKLSGDVFAFVQEAVRDKRLADVDVRGFTMSQNTYRDVCEEGGVLVGFQVGLGKFVSNDIVSSLRPIFRTKDGEKFGKWAGPVPAAPITVKAKSDYVVSGMSMRSALAIDGFTVTFAKLGADGLDLSDTYNSEPAGGNGGRPSSIGGNGALFVGATSHLNNGSPCSLGLVAVLPKE
jgi:S1-C subfamily serine protease